MDIPLLAQTLAALLGPAMPYLVKGGQDLVGDAAKDLGNDAWERLKGLWGLLRPKVEGRSAAREAVEEVAHAPKDDDALGSLRLQLRKILIDDPELTAAVTKLLEQPSGGVSSHVEIHGDGAASVGQGAKAVGAGGILVDGSVGGDIVMNRDHSKERKPGEP